MKVLWTALGVEPLRFQPCGNPGGERCSTELLTVLDPDQTILLIQGTPADVYLRFLSEHAGAWRFAGVHEAYIRNHPRRHQIDRSTGKPLLRISRQGVYGSGLDSEVEDWFDLTEPGFKPVFSFSVQGHEERYGLGISRSVAGTLIAGKDEINVVIDVQFSGEGHSLGSSEYSAVYRRSKGSTESSLQEAYAGLGHRSKIPPTEFEDLADLAGGPSNEDLIRYALPGLKELATGGDVEAKEWLKQFLATVDDTPEVRELKALLR